MKRFVFLLFLLLVSGLRASDYSIPAGRTITWNPAGLDIIGGKPTPGPIVQIANLDRTGVEDCTNKINQAINAVAGTGTVLTIPSGIFRVDNDIFMKNKVVLRGAQVVTPDYMPLPNSTGTTLMMNGSKIFFRGGDRDLNWEPAQFFGIQKGVRITAGYTQGSTSLTVATGGSALSANDIVALYENEDSSQIDDKDESSLGEDSGPDPHVWAQYTKVTGVSGNVITISPGVYQVTANPAATPSGGGNPGPFLRRQRNDIRESGLENLRIYGNGSNVKMIWFQFSQHCWVTGCETYNVGAESSGSPHIWTEFCYGNTYSGNYCHTGASHYSGSDYGMQFFHWNSRHKVEDNIIRDTRHGIIFEGGSGNVILYNYMDDNYESPDTCPPEGTPYPGPSPCELVYNDRFLSEDATANHGAHPYMNLWEGNRASNFWGDYTHGSGSYNTAFRNWFTGKQTGFTLGQGGHPIFLWTVVEIEKYNRYYNIVGNILGNSSFATGTVLDNGSPDTKPEIYRFGYTSSGGGHDDEDSYITAVVNGNYDYVSDSIATWLTAEHSVADSLYYSSRPTFFGKLAWPPYDSSNPGTNAASDQAKAVAIPAGYRYWNGTGPQATATPHSTPFPTATPTPTPTASPTPTATPAPGFIIGLFEDTRQQATATLHSTDVALKAYPFDVKVGDYMSIEGAAWGATAPTDIIVYATCKDLGVGVAMDITLGTVIDSAYRTFIARGFVTNSGPCTVSVNPQGTVNDFSWTQTIYKGVDPNTPVDIDGGNSSGTVGATPSIAGEAATSPLGHGWMHTAVFTHGSATNISLGAGTNHSQTGKNEENIQSQAHVFVGRLLPYATLSNTALATYGAGSGAPWTMQSMGFRAAPTEYTVPLTPGAYVRPVHNAKAATGDF